jgi:hypothetical protein
MNHSKRIFLQATGCALTASALAGCSTLERVSAGPISISKAQLESALLARTGTSLKVADWLTLQISGLQLDLLPQTQRIAIRLTAVLQESMLKSRWPAIAQVQFGLRYDAPAAQFVVTGAQLTQLDLQAVPNNLTLTVQAVVSQNISRSLEGTPVYRLRQQDQDMLARYGVQPGVIRIEPQALVIPLVPKLA